MAETRSIAVEGHTINGFVLAGGRSQRMGRDKADLPWRGSSLLDHMVRLLSTVAAQVRVIGRESIPDKIPGRGPLGGIMTALDITDTQKNLIVAVDLPLLTPGFLQMFRNRLIASTKHLVACKIGSDYPLCLGVDRSMSSVIGRRVEAGLLALHRLADEADAEILSEDQIAAAGFPISMFYNVNTPDDWEEVNTSSPQK